jgi:hypothetical protein
VNVETLPESMYSNVRMETQRKVTETLQLGGGEGMGTREEQGGEGEQRKEVSFTLKESELARL